tara:strand:+ start:773 stop:946 length:174 start_codon:yes stop_codon:yes gene_type:complete
MNRSLDDIYTYEKQAMDILKDRWLMGHIEYDKYIEIKSILADQISDEIRDYTTTRTA